MSKPTPRVALAWGLGILIVVAGVPKLANFARRARPDPAPSAPVDSDARPAIAPSLAAAYSAQRRWEASWRRIARPRQVQLPTGDEVTITGEHPRELELPDGTIYRAVGDVSFDPRPDVLSGAEIFESDPKAMRAVQSALGGGVDYGQAVDDCHIDFVTAGGDLRAYLTWSMDLVVEARDGQGRVVETSVGPEGWPPRFDDAMKDCYVRALSSAVFEAENDFRYTVNYPLCIKGEGS